MKYGFVDASRKRRLLCSSLLSRGGPIVLENVFTAEGDRSITPVVQVLAKTRAVHVIDGDTIVVPVKRVEKVSSNMELML